MNSTIYLKIISSYVNYSFKLKIYNKPREAHKLKFRLINWYFLSKAIRVYLNTSFAHEHHLLFALLQLKSQIIIISRPPAQRAGGWHPKKKIFFGCLSLYI
uniref:Uncharacterized protein n=1 Tax=Dactylella tenuis TaxID=383872 RepID=A0A4Y5MZ42_9PEZI|nr:hypothetical protein [Dactylella tenuis]QCW06835.1 hypothetical protein [Dactylella tenuis]